MSLPTAVFLDTSVLAGQQYNFSSAALSSFAPVATKHKLILLLPDPTEREIGRQIDERSKEALAALDEARRRAPFLSKWKHFPTPIVDARANWEVRRVALNELAAFFKQFAVVKLGYENVDIAEVMRWYDKVLPPFREGKKRKEFPDAFAIAILAAYADKTGTYIAVVSEDQDFKLACNRYSSLLHFRSLPILTELLLGDPGKIEIVRSALLSESDKLCQAIASAVSELPVVHFSPEYDVEDSSVTHVSITDLRVVALGSAECTLTFEADVETENHLVWTEWDHDREEEGSHKEWFVETRAMSGSAKVSLDLASTVVTEVVLLSLDQEYLEVEETPRRRW